MKYYPLIGGNGDGLFIEKSTGDTVLLMKNAVVQRFVKGGGFTTGGALSIGGDVVASGKIDATNLYTDKIEISLSQMVDLIANPHPLVAAQGADTIIQIVSFLMKLKYGSAQFTESADNLILRYVDGSGLAASVEYETTSSFLVAAADGYGWIRPLEQLLIGTVAETVNKGVFLCNTSGDFGSGTGSSVEGWVTYRVHDVS